MIVHIHNNDTLTQRLPGAVAEYQCHPGYTVQGISRRYCKIDGQWSTDTTEATMCASKI